MTFMRAALFCSVAALSTPAHAGEEVLYADLPAWVEEVDMDAILQSNSPADLMRDWQHRLEDGVAYSFSDMAIRLENPQALMQQGTLSLNWLPDKGDLTIHRLEILRGDEVLDLIEQGVTFEVLRRERGLERRLLDGQLTATLAVPGLREGDVMRLAYSVSVDDQALGHEVQATQFLPSDPWQVGMARAIVSWPSDEEIYWRVEDRIDLGEPVERDGYKYLEVDLPLEQRAPIPHDAPSRFQRPDILRVGSFASWNELSEVMTPHFEQAAQLSSGSGVAEQAAAIMQHTSDPKERMAMAVRLVQDEVSYLLNGLDGGNYLPQSAEETWDARYGDCKAKSVLLLAMLREMGIESEVVLVTTQGGDAVPELLPLPAAFNHMIVHAVVDGEDYWLDGTSTASRLSNISDVPPFFHALPLREGGSGLIAMEQRDLAVPQMVVDLTIDHSAGTDFPMLFDLQLQLNGVAGAPLQAAVDAENPDVLSQLARSFTSGGQLEGARVSEIEIAYDEEQAVGTVHVRGVANSMFEWRDGRMEMDVETGSDPDNFNPDRARPAWREIPVATPGPGRQLFESRLILPDGGEGYSLAGETSMSDGFANLRIERHARLEGGMLLAMGENFLRLGEIPADELGDAKREARRIENSRVELVTPDDVTWRWELPDEDRLRRAEPILEAYEKAIELAQDDDYGPLQSRAMFLNSIYDFEAALQDFDVLVEETPSPWAYHYRSSILESLGRKEEAIADLRSAYDLDPQNGTAFALSRMLAYAGQVDEAQEILDYLSVGEGEEITMADLMATISGLSGDADEGLALLTDQLADMSANADALNADCWYRGLFSVALDDAVDLCTRAVERAGFVAAPMDSRALVRFRMGELAGALADLNAALEMAPGLAPSRYLRGVVRLASGDVDGSSDIAMALRMAPELESFYARHGIVPTR